MSFKDHDIKISYRSLGEITISDIVSPLLIEARIYKRSVGYFSSTALDFINKGLLDLAKNNGQILLVSSPLLSEEDIEAIKKGYEAREIVQKCFQYEFEEALRSLNIDNLKLISQLIANNVLNIKIVVKKQGFGMYHDKLAILYDFDGNRVVFTGSNNETAFGYGYNYEKVRVFKSWIDEERVADEEEEFDNIWNGSNDFLDTFDFMEAVKNIVIRISDEVEMAEGNKILNSESEIANRKDGKEGPYDLYDYQKQARENWINNGYKGFFVMATGTGKTVTAIYSLKSLLKKENVFTVIAVPYKHLVSQWYDDVVAILPEAKVLKVSGEISNWDKNIKDAIYSNKYLGKKNIIVISTMKSFYSDRFFKIIKLIEDKKLLIVDEAHNFLNSIYKNSYDIDFEYKMGLSATPIFGRDEGKTKDLLEFFGGMVFELPIDKAIGKYLVNYYYKPIFIEATDTDEQRFNYYTKIMASCFDEKGLITNQEIYNSAYRNRLRAISMADGKNEKFIKTIDQINIKDHFIVYCSDGKLFDEEDGDIKYLLKVVKILNEKEYKPSQFTYEENMNDRKKLIKSFNEGYISSLVAIRCLDEGINIPSIETAIILSSNDNYREFVQRRGRILRKYKGKETATIYDFVVLPSTDCKGMAKIELRRYKEYARLSLEKEGLESILATLLNKYDLTYEDIGFDNEYIDGGETDD